MADETFEYEFRVTGQDQINSALQQLKSNEQTAAQGAQALSGTLQRLTATQQTQSAAVTQGGQRMGQMATALGQVGSLLGRVSPQFATLGATVSAAGGAMTGMTAAAGPVGVAIAAVTAAVTVAVPLIEQLGDHSDSTTTDLDNMAEAAKNAAHEVRGLITAMNEQRRQRAIAAGTATEQTVGEEIATIETRRTRAQAQVEEMQREVAQLRERRARLEQEWSGNPSMERGAALVREQAAIGETIDRIEQSRAASERRITEMEAREGELRMQQMREVLADREAAEEESEQNRDRHRRSRGDREQQEFEAAMQRSLQESIRYAHQLEQERIDAEQRANDAIAQSRRELNQFLHDLDKQQAENREAIRLKNIQRGREEHDAQIAKAQETKARNEELGQITENAWTSVGGSLQNFLGQAFDFIQQGNEATGEGFLLLLDKFLEATASEYAIKAVAEAGEAIGAYARYDYSAGSQHLAAAGVYAAVAGLAGGAAAAIPSPSQAQPQQVTPQQPLGTGGGQNITLQLYAPQAVFTERERGEIFAGGVRAARRELGPGSARF